MALSTGYLFVFGEEESRPTNEVAPTEATAGQDSDQPDGEIEAFLARHEEELEEIIDILQSERLHRFVSWDVEVRNENEIAIVFQGGTLQITTEALNELRGVRNSAPENPVILSFVDRIKDELGIDDFQLSVRYNYRIWNSVREEVVNGRVEFTIPE